ncbi:sugar ABC transporter permease [Anaerocolumna sp. AGMB13025]|jgi:raffinose/stachyose/melibiose transport system permease protein|uniref:carbohydrate ABC transporter permease n=1 Tax=Anaerocolumna sp. AGMB13025 TaxID=3039116 RepID=UPI00241BEA8D|nr:sugar ABC transporter permease [Anaerocolumna sp. AGMB13025]WFR55956.1 sugar ABC transporter permease [Anaerocolumna sp. AGMB13025]
MLSSIRPKNRVIFAYLLFPIALYVFAVFIPLVTAGFYSFFEWKGGPNKTFIGFENYATLFKDSVFWNSFSHNIYLVIACIIGQIGLAFVFVLMINSRLVKLKGIHRTFGFFPSTVSAVSIGFIWSMVYDYKRGILNWFLDLIGKHDATKVWLNEPKLVMLLIAIPLIWQFIGYYMVIILSAISSVDKEIFEVAEIDGANGFQRAIYIVLPLIKNTLLVCVTLCVAGNMKAFDHIFVMTAGGPGNASMVMALYGYKISFAQQNMGYGSAISIGIFFASLVVIGATQLLVKALSKDQGGDK